MPFSSFFIYNVYALDPLCKKYILYSSCGVKMPNCYLNRFINFKINITSSIFIVIYFV